MMWSYVGLMPPWSRYNTRVMMWNYGGVMRPGSWYNTRVPPHPCRCGKCVQLMLSWLA